MKNLKKNLILIASSIAILIGIFLFGKYNRFDWVKKNEKVVVAAVYDSLIAAAQKPPIVVTDTIIDTIKVYVPEIDTMYLPSDTVEITSDRIVLDTLKSKYFTVFLRDQLIYDRIIRAWTYEVYKEEFITTIEVEKPVLVEVPCEYTLNGLYGGGSLYYGYKGMYGASLDVSWLTKKGRMFSLGTGGMYADNKLRPLFRVEVKGKFR